MKKKNLWMICAAAVSMAAGSTVYAADFSDGEAPVISAEEPQLMDSAEIFDDGSLKEQEPVFGDTVSETELPPAEVTASDVPLDEAHFPNNNFRQMLSQKAFDQNENGILEASEIKSITKITSDTLKEFGAPLFETSMYGYQYLTALEELDLQFPDENLLPEYAVLDFSMLPNLRTLSISTYWQDFSTGDRQGSSPVAINLSGNARLTDLTVSCDVSIKALPAECNIRTYRLECWADEYSFNHTAHPDNTAHLLDTVRHIPSLEELRIAAFPKVIPDTSGNPALKKLIISGQTETPADVTLDLTSNENLTELRLSNCALNQYTLDLSNCTRMENLELTDLLVKPTSSENGLSFLDLGSCSAKNVTISQIEASVKIGTAGYLNLRDIQNWNPDRFKDSSGFYVKNSKLYPEMDSEPVDTITCYLNDEKTIEANYRLFTGRLHNPDMVSGLKIKDKTTSSLTCQWNPVKREHDGYVVYVQDSDTNETVKRIKVKKSATSLKVSGLEAGQRYKVVVRAYNKHDGKNYYSTHYKGSILCFTAPKTPSLKAEVTDNRKVKLTWKKTPSAYRDGYSEYVIYYRNAKDKDFKKLAELPDTKQKFTTKKLKKGNTYYFRMRSVICDEDGNYTTKGSYSETIKVTIK
ncbi:MAG: fibronectin type III domain-containing protein [Eubacteriales bacterium]|nr:fibronectin type III domain-containing protein [Eubacteriales bacterium]